MFIDRFRYQATKASQVQSRIKMLDKVVPIEVPPERKRIHFNVPHVRKSGRTVLELEARAQGATATSSSSIDVNLHIERGDRIALVGSERRRASPTLMRLLSRRRGARLRAARRGPQRRDAVFRAGRSDAAWIRRRPSTKRWRPARRIDMVPAIRNILGGFLFSGDDVYKPVRVLSGGERTRLAVARMLLRPSNTLLLDEPDEPPRPRFEGSAARRARGLRRHAHLRLARPVFRRASSPPRSSRSVSRHGRTGTPRHKELRWHNGDHPERDRIEGPRR